jgi:toxin ParE1/3/4
MPILVITDRAELDLAEIGRFIAEDNPINASHFIQRLKKSFWLLAGRPQMGRARSELSSTLRSITFNNYITFYEIIDNGVRIVRVLHGMRDVERIMLSQK